MAGGLIASVITPHTPRMGVEETAPEFVKGMIGGSRELGVALRAMKPDLMVLMSSHWVSTFNWYVTAHSTHQGRCIADEAPDMIPGLEYRQPGDPDFAQALADALKGVEIPCGLNESPHYHWDYGTYVPLKYIDPEGQVPVVTLPTVVCSELSESMAVGRMVHEVAVRAGKTVVFIASAALSHDILRGPELWPTEARQELDRRLTEMVCAGRVADLIQWAPEYCKDSMAEMGGRPLCGMLGAMEALEQASGPLTGRQFGPYGQSSGSGNASLCVTPAQT